MANTISNIISVINPATEALIKEIPADDWAAIASKVEKARQAQPQWAGRSLAERIEAIAKFRDFLTQDVETLAAILTAETGKPITQAKNEILATPQRIDFFIENISRVISAQHVQQNPQNALPGIADLEEIVTYDPLGVVANISAWNYPYFVGTNVFIPALLTGNAVIYKPSEIATMTGLAIAERLHKAGVPVEIFSLVVGLGEAGAHLLEQPINSVFFTGSYETGKKIAIATASKLIKTQLELGGKDPAYVCDDVDVQIAAASLADGAFYNNGQSCCAIERIYVHNNIYDSFLAAFLQAVQQFKQGDPTQTDTYLGPLSRKPKLDVLAQQISDALEKGAKLCCGGQPVEGAGFYFEPTVLTDVTSDMAVMRAETFGPVIGIQRVHDDDEAIALMNDTDYGLTAAVYGKDRARALGILSQINSGSAYWNCCDRVSPFLPWTGRKHSGIGSTLGEEGIRAFLRPRGWHLKP